MKALFFILLFIAACFPLFADPPTFHIPIVSGSGIDPSDNDFLTTMIIMETQVHDFPVMNTPMEADYTIEGIINPYEAFEDNVFYLGLRDNKTGVNILDQNVVFYTINDVVQFLPLLMFNIFSNIPMDPDILPAAPSVSAAPSLSVAGRVSNPQAGMNQTGMDSAWSSMRLYLAVCGSWSPRIYSGETESVHVGNFGAVFMVEWNFLRFVSFGAAFEMSMGDWVVTNHREYKDLVAEIPVYLKGVFRPSTYFLLEPYAGVHFNLTLTGETRPSLLSVLVGFQYGVKAGPGAVIIDLRFSQDLFPSKLNPGIETMNEYRRSLLRAGIGYKIGFFPR